MISYFFPSLRIKTFLLCVVFGFSTASTFADLREDAYQAMVKAKEQAIQLRNQGNFQKALALLKRALFKFRREKKWRSMIQLEIAQTWREWAIFCRNKGDFEQAIRYFRQAREQANSPSLRKALAYELAQTFEVVGALKQAVKIYLANRYFQEAATLYLKHRQPQKAVGLLKKIWKCPSCQNIFYLSNPKSHPPSTPPTCPKDSQQMHLAFMESLALAYEQLNQWKNAEKAYLLGLRYLEERAEPTSAVWRWKRDNYHRLLGRFYASQKKYTQAREQFSRIAHLTTQDKLFMMNHLPLSSIDLKDSLEEIIRTETKLLQQYRQRIKEYQKILRVAQQMAKNPGIYGREAKKSAAQMEQLAKISLAPYYQKLLESHQNLGGCFLKFAQISTSSKQFKRLQQAKRHYKQALHYLKLYKTTFDQQQKNTFWLKKYQDSFYTKQRQKILRRLSAIQDLLDQS